MVVAAIDWTQVILAGIGACVTIANGLGIAIIYSHLRTPSRTSIGKQVESLHHVALGNNYRLQSLTGELNVDVPPDAAIEEAQRQPPNGAKGKGA